MATIHFSASPIGAKESSRKKWPSGSARIPTRIKQRNTRDRLERAIKPHWTTNRVKIDWPFGYRVKSDVFWMLDYYPVAVFHRKRKGTERGLMQKPQDFGADNFGTHDHWPLDIGW